MRWTLGMVMLMFALWAHGHPASGEKIVVKGLGEIGYTFLFEESSQPDESLDAFVQRIAPQLAAFSQQTGMEACGIIAQQDHRWGVRVGTNHSHIVCLNFPHKVPDGMSSTGLTLHSHPPGRYYRVNAADRVVLGRLTALNTQVERGPKGFSPEDFGSGAGYLVEGNQVFFQAGVDAVRTVGQ